VKHFVKTVTEAICLENRTVFENEIYLEKQLYIASNSEA
jgi:hypothetical protein